jgi:ESCRT-II complex subunit VPS36
MTKQCSVPHYLKLRTEKAPEYQAGVVYATSHRLFYVDHQRPETNSFALDLTHITQTDHYAGLFKSSPKLTLHLGPPPQPQSAATSPDAQQDPVPFESWECEVCSYRNPPGLSPSAARACALCGVPRSSLSALNSNSSAIAAPSSSQPTLPSQVQPQSLSASLPNTPSPLAAGRAPSAIACPACTFLNHPSLHECEICGTPLPRPAQARVASMKSAPASRLATPPPDDARFIKLSFRKGGDKPFYAALKRCLMAKAWEVSVTSHLPTH